MLKASKRGVVSQPVIIYIDLLCDSPSKHDDIHKTAGKHTGVEVNAEKTKQSCLEIRMQEKVTT